MTTSAEIDQPTNEIVYIHPALDDIRNGRRWRCEWPYCWRVITQWIDGDQWCIMTEDEPRMIHRINGDALIVPRQRILDWLIKMRARPTGVEQ